MAKKKASGKDADVSGSTRRTRRKQAGRKRAINAVPKDVVEQEAAAVKRLWTELAPLSQHKFVQQYKLGRQAYFYQVLNGKRPINEKFAFAFVDCLNVTLDEFSPRLALKMRGAEGFPLAFNRKARNPGASIRFLGSVQTTNTGYWNQSALMVAPQGGSRVRFESLDPEAYAIQINSEAMAPRIRSGEIIVLAPSRQIKEHDEVVLTLTDGKKCIREFLTELDDKVIFASVTAAREKIAVPRNEIVAMHYLQAIMKPDAMIVDTTVIESLPGVTQ
jgi:hypothetical protein